MQEKLRDVAGCFCIFIKIFREVKDVRSEAHLLLILAAFWVLLYMVGVSAAPWVRRI